MPFLTLAGITVPLSTSNSGAIEPVRAGEYGRTFGNKPYRAVRSESRDYRGGTPLQARRTSLAYQLLVGGEGHAFPFDTAGSGATADYYSTKGLAPLAVTGSLVTAATGGPVDNGGRLSLDVDEDIAYTLPPFMLEEATLSIWVKNADTSGNWQHYVLEWNDAGSTAVAAWQSGSIISPSGLTNAIEESVVCEPSANGSFFLSAPIATEYAEILLLPFRASLLRSDWADYVYNSGLGRAVEDLPYLSMGGSWVPPGDSTQTDEVLGELLGQRLVDTVVSGNTVQFEAFDFVLRSRNVR